MKINLCDFAGNHPENDKDDDHRTLTVKRVSGGLRFREECDAYFYTYLTPAEVRGFIEKLQYMLDQPEPKGDTP
jgi:hypothetical protein